MCRIPAVTNFTAIHVYTLGTEEMCYHDKAHLKRISHLCTPLGDVSFSVARYLRLVIRKALV